MLDATSVFLSFAIISILAFPVGYVSLRIFHPRLLSKITFFTALPLYLSVGIAIQFLLSFIIGTSSVSPLIPIAVAVVCSAIIAVSRVFGRAQEEDKLNRSTFINISSLMLFSIVFYYFAQFPIALQWPPAGDAVQHSALVSLAIEQGHLPFDLDPISPVRNSYPVGYHMLSANLSLLLNLNPGEVVFILASYIMALICGTLFSFTFMLTRSYWLSLPSIFFLMIPHSTGNLERWVFGYLINGPYPNLFGFLALIILFAIAQASFAERRSILKTSLIVFAIMAAIIVVYPVFIFHAIFIVVVYATLHKVKSTYTLLAVQRSKSGSFSYYHLIFRPESKGTGIHSHPLGMRATLQQIKFLTISNASHFNKVFSNPIALGVSLALPITIALLVFSTGLMTYLSVVASSNISWFDQRQTTSYLAIGSILPSFLTDDFARDVLGLLMIASIAVMFRVASQDRTWLGKGDWTILSIRLAPISVILFLLLTLLYAGFVLISAQRTLAFISLLTMPMIAYTISEFKPNRSAKLKIAGYVTVAIFVASALYVQIPYVQQQLQRPDKGGWFLTKFDEFGDTYEAATWIKNHSEKGDLILNDRSYSSLYIDGFYASRLVYNLWSIPSDPKIIDLAKVWTQPNNRTQVYSLLTRYDISYIVITPESGYLDYGRWDGSGKYLAKPMTSGQYQKIFDSYDFLRPEFKEGGAAIYSVISPIPGQSSPSLTITLK